MKKIIIRFTDKLFVPSIVSEHPPARHFHNNARKMSYVKLLTKSHEDVDYFLNRTMKLFSFAYDLMHCTPFLKKICWQSFITIQLRS